jgi:hypothetical protein
MAHPKHARARVGLGLISQASAFGRTWRTTASLFVFGAGSALALRFFRGYAFRLLSQPLGIFDEPLQLVGGMFSNLGQKPMVDFRSVYPPLNYYVVAWVFRTFGSSVVAFRLYEIAMLGLAVAAIGWIAWRNGGGLWKLGASVAAVSLIAGGTLETTTTPAVALGALSLAVYAEASRREANRLTSVLYALAGVLLFATAFTRLNFGLYLGAAVAGERCVAFFHDWRDGAGARRALSPLPMAASFLLCLLLVVMSWWGHLGSFLDQIIVAPSRAIYRYSFPVNLIFDTSAARRELLRQGFYAPLLPGLWLAVRALTGEGRRRAYPVMVGVVTAAACLMLMTKWGMAAPDRLPLVAVLGTLPVFVVSLTHPEISGVELVVLGTVGLASHYALSRPDHTHFLSLLPLTAALVPFALPRSFELRQLLPALLLGGLVASTVNERLDAVDKHSFNIGKEVWEGRSRFLSSGDVQTATHREDRLARYLFPDDYEITALNVALEKTTPNDPLYVGFQNHASSTVINDVRAYWLSGRPTAVRDVMQMNGLTSVHSAERRMIEDLENSGVARIILWQGFLMTSAWGLHLLADSSGALDWDIQDSFHLIATHGAFQVWERNPDKQRPNRLALHQ